MTEAMDDGRGTRDENDVSFLVPRHSEAVVHRPSVCLPDLTVDTVFEGRLRVKQLRRGYRFSVDAVLLAHFAGPLTNETVLDLGTGCGIISLVLASRYPGIVAHGVELQPELAEIAGLNALENALADRVRIHALDMKRVTTALTSGPMDLVICNPPFHPASAGRINPDSQRAVARHEIGIALREVAETAARMLIDGGRFSAVYPAGRMDEMLSEMRRAGLAPRTFRMVHPKADGPAKLFLVEGIKTEAGALEEMPPLVLYDSGGAYTEEAAAMFLL